MPKEASNRERGPPSQKREGIKPTKERTEIIENQWKIFLDDRTKSLLINNHLKCKWTEFPNEKLWTG